MDGTISGDVKSDSYDLRSLLCSDKRDFLVHNNGVQVKIGDLDGKIVGLYFSASWCPPCRRFTPNFAEVYDEFSARWRFEVVYVSKDRDEESFNEYYSHMPWLAVPFSDLKTRKRLSRSFITKGIPHLVILDGNGKVITTNGVGIITNYLEERSLFTPESIEELVAKEVAARDAQSLASILVSGSRDFLISSNGNKVAVSELEGKIVGLYFAVNSYTPCKEFTPKLVKFYRELKGKGERFEIVFVSLDEDENSFKEQFDGMPWLALPFNSKDCMKLTGYFELDDIPMLTIIGPDGKTMNHNVLELVDEHGIEAYPFTPEKIAGLAEIMKARRESQTLESLLITSGRDSVIGSENIEVPVSGLTGRNILLFFAAGWCRRSHAFLPKLIKSYHEIKEKDQAFEVIFISMDQDQASFVSFFSDMPWLALPFHDNSRKTFSRAFETKTTPSLIAIGPDGRTITKDARDLLMIHGSDAYPFDKHHSKQLEVSLEEMVPKEIKHAAHVTHALVLTRRVVYTCDGCEIEGHMWSFYCEECEFDLHPICGLEQGNVDGNEEHDDHVHGDEFHELESRNEGYKCDGDVCYKV